MKRGIMLAMLMVVSLFGFSSVSAVGCDLTVSMINQDPYPAIQGEEATVVFQIDGVADSECGDVEFGLVEKYPISLMPDQEEMYTFESGTFKKDFKSFFLAPFKIKVSEEALDGDNKIEVKYRNGKDVSYTTKEFNLNVKDTRAEFEVHVKDYDFGTKQLTFEILNIAEEDVEALTIEIPVQDGVLVKGANRNIVGDLDSNDYTTADFKATLTGEEVEILIHYSDQIHERRTVTETVSFVSENFVPEEVESNATTNYVILAIVVLLIVWWVIRRNKKKKALEEKLKSKSRR